MLKPVKIFAIGLMLTSAALAASLQEANDLYVKGNFDEAATMAASLNSEAGFVLAAKATSIFSSTRPEKEQDALYTKAEAFARKAIEQNKNNAEAHFEASRALGRLSQLRGVVTALMQGLGGKVKDELDMALKLKPNYPGALVGLGLWHAEVSAKGALAAMSLGASADKAVPLFEKAIKLEPKVIIHRVEYAKALMILNKNNKDKAIEQLNIALKLEPRDAAEKMDLERTKNDLANLNK